MRAILIIFLVVVAMASNSFAQIFSKAIDFNIGTPYLEPDNRDLSLKVNDHEFVCLAKAKGGLMGPSQYVLAKYTSDLQSVFKVNLTANLEEEYFKMILSGDKIRLFTILHDFRTLVAQCKVYEFSIADGALLNTKVLSETTIKNWSSEMGKGAVSENFTDVISSSQTRNFVTPLEYLYKINFSPDNTKFILYIFDYSQKYLIAQATVYDQDFKVLSKGVVPIDKNFINYGLHINNKGELFILNVDRGGRIALIKYNMETKDNIFLDIASSASKRYSFKLKFLNDDVAYVFNLSSRSEKFSGVMYSKFNFNDKLVEKVNHQDLSEGMIQTATVLRQHNKDYETVDDWLFYEISDVYINAYEKIIVVVEKRKIESAVFTYASNSVAVLDNWYEKAGRVLTGPLLLYSFNADDVLLWETYCLKKQSNDMTAGLLSASYAMNITDKGIITMTYASSSSVNGAYNEINYLEFEELSGSRIKNIKLENKEGLSLLKDYTVWFDNSLILGTRKGLFGSKSFLVRYSLQ